MSKDTYRGTLTIEIDSTDKAGITLALNSLRELAQLWNAAHSNLIIGANRNIRKIALGDEFTDDEVIAAVNELYEIGQELVDDPHPGPCTQEDGKDLVRIAEALDVAADSRQHKSYKTAVKALQEAMNVDTAVREYIPETTFEIIIKLGGWK